LPNPDLCSSIDIDPNWNSKELTFSETPLKFSLLTQDIVSHYLLTTGYGNSFTFLLLHSFDFILLFKGSGRVRLFLLWSIF
jgi:hypothetical protein